MKIFISYHLADSKSVKKIRTKLVARGITYYSVPEDANFDGWSNQKISEYFASEMDDCQILLCVVGLETYSRPHVDHELHHSLKGGVGVRKGWIVSLLESRGDSIHQIDYHTFPNRIQDNEEYACMTQNASLFSEIDDLIEEAVHKRNDPQMIINNRRPCMKFSSKKYYE